MRLGFYYHVPAVLKEDQIWVAGYLGRFYDSLADHFDRVVMFQHLPNKNENVKLDYNLKSTNIKLISLPPRKSVPNRVLHSRKYTKFIEEHSSSLDALLLRGPSPLLPAMAGEAGDLPTVLLIVGDYLAGVNTLPQPWWRKQLIRLWSFYNTYEQMQVAKKSLVFVNSRKLYHQFDGEIENLKQTRTTTLSRYDFYRREDTCQDRPIRLLYTGRMDPAKGLLDMVEALGILVREGEDVVLDLVGWPENGSDILLQIEDTAYKGGVEDRLFYHGYKAVGPELFAYYKEADIYIIASQSSEGFPRTIWEAMAHSLPVVATKVGGIPDFIENAAVLVPPKDLQSLVEGIRRLIHDAELRKNNIVKGFSLARQNTLEIQVGKMSQEIKNWLN